MVITACINDTISVDIIRNIEIAVLNSFLPFLMNTV